MKQMLFAFACGLGLLASVGAAKAQNFYLDGNAGVALADKVDLHRFIVPTPHSKLDLDPGARVSVAGGYNVCDYFAVQAETGFIYNSVKNSHGDAWLSHVPMLADAVLKYDKANCDFIPYLGAGVGGDVSIITLHHVQAPDGSTVRGSAGTAVFAWQAFAGARYRINKSMSAGAGYKYFAAEGASWDVRHAAGDIKTGMAGIHSILADFTWNF